MTSSPPQAPRPVARKIVVDLSIMTVIGVVLAFIGPFGSFNAPLSLRLISWVGFAWLGYAIYSPMGLLVDRLEASLHLPRPGLWLLAVLVATIPMTAIVWILGFVPRMPDMPTLEQALTSYFYVFLVGGAVTALFYTLESRKQEASPSVSSAQPSSEPASFAETTSAPSPDRFIERLPPHLGSDLIALEMEDHYVRAHTMLGSELVLMRLRDAIAELEDLEGLQVHRSWWVARHAVSDVKREGRNVRLVLETGLEAPVSRANVQSLKDAGWI